MKLAKDMSSNLFQKGTQLYLYGNSMAVLLKHHRLIYNSCQVKTDRLKNNDI